MIIAAILTGALMGGGLILLLNPDILSGSERSYITPNTLQSLPAQVSKPATASPLSSTVNTDGSTQVSTEPSLLVRETPTAVATVSVAATEIPQHIVTPLGETSTPVATVSVAATEIPQRIVTPPVSPPMTPTLTAISTVRPQSKTTGTPGVAFSMIQRVAADGSGLIQLTNSPARDLSPAWSPDGTGIAFASDRDKNPDGTDPRVPFDIYVMNTDGSAQTNLTNSPADDKGPARKP
jgi:hypothetical protein